MSCRSLASLYILYWDKSMVVIPYVNIGLYCIEQLTPGSLIVLGGEPSSCLS